MATTLRSFAKINLGLAIGPPRPDGFHSLLTLYQTLALHDALTVSARTAARTRIELTSNDRRVPRDHRNTAYRMAEAFLAHTGLSAEVDIHIDKQLPIQGGMGAGSANAAAALLGLERELKTNLPEATRLALAAGIGSDVPLFLLGGAVFGLDRGQRVSRAPSLQVDGHGQIPAVIALPAVGVSTPQAFRDWDAHLAAATSSLQTFPEADTIAKLSRTYAFVFGSSFTEAQAATAGPSGIDFHSGFGVSVKAISANLQETPSANNRVLPENEGGDRTGNDPAESLLELVRAGIENDFETVVFPQHPSLLELKHLLKGPSDGEHSALYAALSGSGSAVFGLYRTTGAAHAAQQRLQHAGIRALVTTTLPSTAYWNQMFAE